MKLFHLSDLHIGKRVNEFSMLEDQKYILGQILKAAKEYQPEGIILAGDIYDKPVPAAEAVQVFDDFLRGAKEGMGTVVQVVPSLVGLMTAVGVLRASGFLEFLSQILEAPATSLGLPGPIIPIAFVRMISNSAAVGLLLDLFKNYGPDSRIGLMASILMGSTETVLYCMSVYFGSVGISRTRYTLAGGFLAALVSLAVGVFLADRLVVL